MEKDYCPIIQGKCRENCVFLHDSGNYNVGNDSAVCGLVNKYDNMMSAIMELAALLAQ